MRVADDFTPEQRELVTADLAHAAVMVAGSAWIKWRLRRLGAPPWIAYAVATGWFTAWAIARSYQRIPQREAAYDALREREIAGLAPEMPDVRNLFRVDRTGGTTN